MRIPVFFLLWFFCGFQHVAGNKEFQQIGDVNGKAYYFCPDALQWCDAREECKKIGGDLISKTETESQSFQEQFTSCGWKMNTVDKIWTADKERKLFPKKKGSQLKQMMYVHMAFERSTGNFTEEFCSERYPFICGKDTAAETSMTSASQDFELDLKTWTEALRHCQNKNGNLANKDDVKKLMEADASLKLRDYYVWVSKQDFKVDESKNIITRQKLTRKTAKRTIVQNYPLVSLDSGNKTEGKLQDRHPFVCKYDVSTCENHPGLIEIYRDTEKIYKIGVQSLDDCTQKDNQQDAEPIPFDIDNRVYQYFKTRMKFDEATEHCKRHNGEIPKSREVPACVLEKLDLGPNDGIWANEEDKQGHSNAHQATRIVYKTLDRDTVRRKICETASNGLQQNFVLCSFGKITTFIADGQVFKQFVNTLTWWKARQLCRVLSSRLATQCDMTYSVIGSMEKTPGCTTLWLGIEEEECNKFRDSHMLWKKLAKKGKDGQSCNDEIRIYARRKKYPLISVTNQNKQSSESSPEEPNTVLCVTDRHTDNLLFPREQNSTI